MPVAIRHNSRSADASDVAAKSCKGSFDFEPNAPEPQRNVVGETEDSLQSPSKRSASFPWVHCAASAVITGALMFAAGMLLSKTPEPSSVVKEVPIAKEPSPVAAVRDESEQQKRNEHLEAECSRLTALVQEMEAKQQSLVDQVAQLQPKTKTPREIRRAKSDHDQIDAMEEFFMIHAGKEGPQLLTRLKSLQDKCDVIKYRY